MAQGRQVVLVTGVSRDLGRRFARAVADRPCRRAGHRRRRRPAAGRHRRRLLRPRRHPQPGHRQGHRQGGRRHRRPHERDLDPRQRRGPQHDEGAQRHRHDAAAGGLPEGARAAAPRGEVDDDGLRRQQPRPGDVHRGHGAAAARREPGYAKDVAEIEGYVRGFARRRPDVRVTILRLANVIGPHVVEPDHVLLPAAGRSRPCSATTRGCSSCTSTTCIAVLQHAVTDDVPGTFNVAGDGVLMLSQAVRRLQRPTVPMPALRAWAASARPCARRGSPTSRPSSWPSSPTVVGWTPPGCASSWASTRATPPRTAFADFAAGARADRRPRRRRAWRRLVAALPSVDGAGDSRKGSSPWVTPRSSRSGPAADPAAAAARSRPAPRAASRRAAWTDRPDRSPPAPEPGDSADAAGRVGRGGPPEAPAPAPARDRAPAGRPRPATAQPARRHPAGEWLAAFQHAAARGLRRAVGAPARPVPRLPAPPGHRRLRRRRVRLRRRDHPALLHGRAAADRAEVVPDRGPRGREHPRPTAAPWSSPTTPARCPSTA